MSKTSSRSSAKFSDSTLSKSSSDSAVDSPGKAFPIPELANLPTITMNMMLEQLAAFNIVAAPPASRRVFRWFETPFIEAATRPAGFRSGQILHICRLSDARSALEDDPNLFACMVLAPDESLPQWRAEFTDRLVVVQPDDSFMYLVYMVQCYFMNMALWESKLDYLASQPDGLQLLLESSQSMLGEFVLCYDAADQVLASTLNIEAPIKTLQAAVKSGHFSPAPGRTRKSASAGDDACQVKRAVIVDGLRFATVLMQAREPVTPGMVDVLDILCKRIDLACKALWHNQVKSTNPYHFFFARLIEGAPCSRDDIDEQLDAIGIPPQHQLKLVLFDIAAGREPAPAFSELAPAVKRINHGDCYYFAYQGFLCLLCYAVAGDSQLSDKKTTADVKRFIAEPYHIPASASMIFEDITDLDLAYKQAVIARNLRSLVEAEAANSVEVQRMRAADDAPELIPFEACVIYYLVGARNKDDRFLDFIFSHTLMQKISEEDRQNGTNNLEIFWEYISSERNASIVAERMHVHRNTVRYRIDKIERRFDLDLSSQQVREKMVVDFKVFFLMQQRASLKQLFE